jgi:hypothetical protein
MGIPCTPSCIACHLTDPGDATNWSSKKLPQYVAGKGINRDSTDAAVTAVLQQYLTEAATVQEQADTVKALRDGKDIESGGNLCGGPTYGCGAHIARKAAPRDASLAWLLGAVVAGSWLRRRAPRVS